VESVFMVFDVITSFLFIRQPCEAAIVPQKMS
jgi:hypothetical protein